MSLIADVNDYVDVHRGSNPAEIVGAAVGALTIIHLCLAQNTVSPPDCAEEDDDPDVSDWEAAFRVLGVCLETIHQEAPALIKRKA